MDILYVYEPKIIDDTVYYSWNTNNPLGIFKKNEFYIKYDGLNISDIDTTYFYEMFVSLMIPVFKSYSQDILIILPEEIPEDTVNNWLSYNEADNIKVFPTVKQTRIENVFSNQESEKLGILFGGGKDSLYAYHVNKEIFGAENLIIISYVFPMDYSTLNKIDTRRDKFALDHLRDDGVTVQKVYTDFRSIFEIYSYFNSIHTQLYYSMNFPLYFKYGISYLTYSYEFTEYWNQDKKGNKIYRFKKSRPEFDEFLSSYLGQRFGKPLKIFNSNYYLSETLAFKLLNSRYNALDNLMMCEADVNPEVKWCTKCKKCGEFVLYSLANKYESSELDFNEFLSQSPFILKTIAKVEEKAVEINQDGNVRWFDGLISPVHYMSFCHIIYHIDMDFWANKLGETAIGNLLKLKKWFGNKSYDILDSYMSEALNQLNLPVENQLRNILDNSTTRIDSKVIELLFADTERVIDYRLQYPLHFSTKNELKNADITKELINSTKYKFNLLYNPEIRCYNKDTKDAIPFVSEESTKGFSFYIDKSAPKVGDTIELTYTFDKLDPKKSYHIQLDVLSPSKSEKYKKRFYYSVLLDTLKVIEEDISDWNLTNNINIYFNPTNTKHTITLKVETFVNCEPWNWGRAAQLIIEKLNIRQVKNVETTFVSHSSPYSQKMEAEDAK